MSYPLFYVVPGMPYLEPWHPASSRAVAILMRVTPGEMQTDPKLKVLNNN